MNYHYSKELKSEIHLTEYEEIKQCYEYYKNKYLELSEMPQTHLSVPDLNTCISKMKYYENEFKEYNNILIFK